MSDHGKRIVDKIVDKRIVDKIGPKICSTSALAREGKESCGLRCRRVKIF